MSASLEFSLVENNRFKNAFRKIKVGLNECIAVETMTRAGALSFRVVETHKGTEVQWYRGHKCTGSPLVAHPLAPGEHELQNVRITYRRAKLTDQEPEDVAGPLFPSGKFAYVSTAQYVKTAVAPSCALFAIGAVALAMSLRRPRAAKKAPQDRLEARR